MKQGVFICAALVYTALLLGLLTAGKEEHKKKYYVKAKSITSLGFLAISLLFTFVSGNWETEWRLLPPLLLCMMGDVFLAKYQTESKKKHMLMGIVSFLLAHIGLLIFMYSIHAESGWYVIAAPAVTLCILFFLVQKFHLKLGSLRLPVIIYSVFVSSMMAKAAAMASAVKGMPFLCIGIGGILFFLSDVSIIFLYFYHYKKKGHRRYVQIFNLVTYYYAILFFDLYILIC